MTPKFEHIFHTEPKRIGMIEIYSNPMDKNTVKDIEKVIKNVASNLHINLDNIPSGEVLSIYIYPTAKVFFSIFGSELERKGRRRLNKGKEELYFIVSGSEIHMVSPNGVANGYTDMIKILIGDILEEYELEDKSKKAKEKVDELLEPEEKEEEQEEPEEDEIEEEIEEQEDLEEDEELLIQVEEIDEKIEEIKKEKDVPEWLDLGWIMYKRGILKNQETSEKFAEHIKEKGVTGQGRISGKQSIVADYNYSAETASAIVEYIVENYGVRKVLELYENPDVKAVLGISKDKFSRECKANIKKRYVKTKLDELNEENVKEEKIK